MVSNIEYVYHSLIASEHKCEVNIFYQIGAVFSEENINVIAHALFSKIFSLTFTILDRQYFLLKVL